MKVFQTAERNTENLVSDNIILCRHLIAYKEAEKLINGNVLEIGSGEGYGIKMLAPKSARYLAVDKYNTQIDEGLKNKYNIEFKQAKVPPLSGISDDQFDFAVCFQVIEHIKNDNILVKEIYRVLKPDGKFVMTTPNIKMSLTRNPWHIREYTKEQLLNLVGTVFSNVSLKGICGNEKVMEYHEENRKSVERITRFDILNLQYNLPRQFLQIPYDIMNRMNRKKLLKQNTGLVKDVSVNDFFLSEADDKCLDFFCVAVK